MKKDAGQKLLLRNIAHLRVNKKAFFFGIE